MKTEVLEEFVVLAKHLSFTAAAKELYVSQPRLSSHIKSLEEELGFELFSRSSGTTLHLTSAGSIFLESAQKTLSVLQGGIRQAYEMATDETPVAVSSLPLSSASHEALMKVKSPRFVFIDIPEDMAPFAALDKDIIDICNQFDYREIPRVRNKAEELGLEFIKTGQGKITIHMMASHPLAAKEQLTREDLRNLKVNVIRGVFFDTWPLLIEMVLGDDLGMEFSLSQLRSTQNLMFLDIGDKVHICSDPVIDTFLSERDDVITFDRIDGEEIFYPDGFVFKKTNERARALVQALVEEAPSH